jgi:Spy/CpxP family protein refolding chaperone
MKRTRVFALAAVLAGGLLASTMLAQVPDTDGDRRGPARFGEFRRDGGLPLRALNLTDAQRQQVQTLVQQSHEQNRDLMSQLRQARAARRAATEAVPLDEQAIRSTTQALVDAETNAAIARAKLRADIFALLTPEQQAQVGKLKAERPERQSPRGVRGARS